MRPWGTITGRIVDDHGKPIDLSKRKGIAPALALDNGIRRKLATHDDPNIAEIPYTEVDRAGRFRIERIVPGQRCGIEIRRDGQPAGMAFENIVLEPGEVRDLGEIRAEATAR
jgi:hypothetical protein